MFFMQCACFCLDFLGFGFRAFPPFRVMLPPRCPTVRSCFAATGCWVVATQLLYDEYAGGGLPVAVRIFPTPNDPSLFV